MSIEVGRTGTFNVGGRVGITIGEILETCRAVSGVREATFVWASEPFLRENGVTPWVELPLWVPLERDHFVKFDSSKAVAADLRTRPLAETVRDILAWERTRPPAVERRAGMTADREAELLRRWQAAQGTST